MKPWMKVAMWFGIGLGFGLCVGTRLGERYKSKHGHEQDDEDWVTEEIDGMLDEYAGDISTVDGIDKILREPTTDDDEPEMPTEKDIEIDDIPQLHPSHLVPEIISEEEYNLNIWHYDLENLLFYEIDEVLYDETTQDIIQNPDDVIGIGTLFEFGGNPNNPVETIYVKNDTFGTLFRIDRLDAAFCDAVDGNCGPEDDTPDDDFWDDV